MFKKHLLNTRRKEMLNNVSSATRKHFFFLSRRQPEEALVRLSFNTAVSYKREEPLDRNFTTTEQELHSPRYKRARVHSFTSQRKNSGICIVHIHNRTVAHILRKTLIE